LWVQCVWAMLLVSVPPVVECSSWSLGGGADLSDRLPLPTLSDAPPSQLGDVSRVLHVGTPRFLALNMCAICGGIAETPEIRSNRAPKRQSEASGVQR